MKSIRTQPVPWLIMLLQPALAQGQQRGDRAQVVLGHVDGQPLHRLVELAVDLPGDDGGACRR